jgi:hypothetical protein
MMMINRRRVCGGKSLPYDAEIEYLESTGNGEYINLGISPSSDIRFTYDALYPTIESANFVEGCIESSGSTYKRFHIGASRNNFEGGIGTVYGRISDANTNRHTFQISGKINIAYCDGNFYVGNSNYPSLPIYLFCRNFNGTASNSHRVRIYNAHIYSYSQSKKILDLIPVRKNGVGYLYDKVSGQLFGNSGSGNFILGPDK